MSSPRRCHFYSRPCGRGDKPATRSKFRTHSISTHAPAGGATFHIRGSPARLLPISTHAPAGGATVCLAVHGRRNPDFYSRPCGRGDRANCKRRSPPSYFYSRPCGRGDSSAAILTRISCAFLLTPLREGRRFEHIALADAGQFLLTPLREGRLKPTGAVRHAPPISTHAPAGGATWH